MVDAPRKKVLASGLAKRTHGRISSKDSFANVVREVERVADERHPAKEVGQAEDAKTRRHVDDRPEVLRQRRDRLLRLLTLFHGHRALEGGHQIEFHGARENVRVDKVRLKNYEKLKWQKSY